MLAAIARALFRNFGRAAKYLTKIGLADAEIQILLKRDGRFPQQLSQIGRARAHKKAGVIFINTPIHGCLERNQSHQDHIPDTVVVNLFAAIELPRPSEGFQEILVVE